MSNPPFKRDDDAEWSKVITAVLIKGSTIICFDNVDGLLRSPSLASAITAKVYSGRILGFSKTVEIPVNVSWFVNGNNIQLGGDLPRRCYWIRLDAKMSRPGSGTSVVVRHRGGILRRRDYGLFGNQEKMYELSDVISCWPAGALHA